MSDIFVTYSRGDREFANTIVQALMARGKSVWIDEKSITPSAPWLEEIYAAIADADIILAIISPLWRDSDICQRELRYALSLSKKIVPVVASEVDPGTLDDRLAKLQFLVVARGERLADYVSRLVAVLDTDIDLAHLHTRYLARAAEWKAAAAGDASKLMRGRALAEAESWQEQSAGKLPTVTSDQAALIAASRRAASSRQRRSIAVARGADPGHGRVDQCGLRRAA